MEEIKKMEVNPILDKNVIKEIKKMIMITIIIKNQKKENK